MDLINTFGFITQANVLSMALACCFSVLFASTYYYAGFYIVQSKYTITVKVASVVSLFFLVIFASIPNDISVVPGVYNLKYLILAALFFHVIGDAVIELKDNLLFCMPFFMLGHIIYSYIFFQDLTTIELAFRQVIVLILAVSFGLWMSYTLLPKLSGIMLPGVSCYMSVLAIEAILAIFHPASYVGVPWLLIGVLMYILSDCLLAYHDFVKPIRIRLFLVWPLYFIAQLLITMSLLQHAVKIP